MLDAKGVTRGGDVRRWAGCDIQRKARRIREEGDTEREERKREKKRRRDPVVRRSFSLAAIHIPWTCAGAYFLPVSPLRRARTDLFAPLPRRRVPTIPVLGRPVLLPHSCTRRAPYVAPRRRCSTGRWNTRGLIQIIGLPSYPGPCSPFFSASPFRPFFSFYSSIWPLPFFSASSPSLSLSLSSILWQLIISLIYRMLVSLSIYLSLPLLYVHTRWIYAFRFSIICVCTFES